LNGGIGGLRKPIFKFEADGKAKEGPLENLGIVPS